MQAEVITLHEDRNVTLTCYLQPVLGEFGNIPDRPAMVVLPGGGYYMCSDREADPVALPYLAAGYQVFILRYTVGEGTVWPQPLEDYEEAMELIKKNAKEWHVLTDHIAVVGFSAGGHLAACTATLARNKPTAAILGYPVIDGSTVATYLKDAPDAAQAVDRETSPCFVFASRNDSLVPVKNSLEFLAALEQSGICFESHIYSNAPHGFSVANTSVQLRMEELCSRVPGWVPDSIEWLRDVMGDFGDGAMNKARFGAKLNGNTDPFLNLDCTVAYLFGKPEAAPLVQQILSGAAGQRSGEGQEAQPAMDPEKTMAMVGGMTLRTLLGFAGLSAEQMDGIQEMLGKIPNC